MEEKKKHPFSYTLGAGPYKIVDLFVLIIPSEANHGRNNFHLAPQNLKQGCGTCAHCGHGIINNYIVRNGAGELFPVGSECVEKCRIEGEFENLTKFEKLQRKLRSEQGRQRRERQRNTLKLSCEALVKENQVKLSQLPHPTTHESYKHLNAYDYCLYYLKTGHTLGGYKIFKQKLVSWGCTVVK